MGSLLAKLYNEILRIILTDTSQRRVLLLGLESSGKTTILYRVKLNENISTTPTIGFNVETFSPVRGLTLTMWDVGGQEIIRSQWKQYIYNIQGLLFIVDSSDLSRMFEAKYELHGIINEPDMCRVPVVVVANKQDLPGALSIAEVTDILSLNKLEDHNWFVQPASATTGDGICEAMQEMAKLVKEFNKL